MYMIPSGFVFKSTDFYEVHQQLTAFRPKAEELILGQYLAVFTDEVVRRIDNDAIEGKLMGSLSSYLGIVSEDIRHRQKMILLRRERDPSIDMEFIVTLYPHRDRILGTIHTEHREWEQAFRDAIPSIDYGVGEEYPDDKTEFEARDSAWKEAFGHTTSRYEPTTTGLKFTYEVLHGFCPSLSAIFANAPSRRQRLRENAKNIISGERYQKLYEQNPHISACLMQSYRYTETDEAKPLIEAKIRELHAILPYLNQKEALK